MNCKMTFSFVEVEHSEADMMKIMSNLIALNATLYSIDYHGYENGSKWFVEDGVYKLIIIINNDAEARWYEIPDSVIIDVKDEMQRRKYKINKWNVEIIRSEMKYDIPEDYIEQYFARSYWDIEGADM